MSTATWCSSLAVGLLSLGVFAQPDGGAAFRPLQPGVELAAFTLVEHPEAGDGRLHVVRIDPGVATLDLALASETGAMKTAAQWAAQQGFSVVINAGMFETDYRSNVGRLVHGAHVNQKGWKSSYQSVLVLDPLSPKLPRAALLDRDEEGFDERVKGYRTVVQNLRLVKSPGVNVWKPNGRKWSEALVATDDRGRLLFCFSRTPFEMADLMKRLVALPLGVLRAMHVEGGPEASLSIHTPGLTLDLSGSYETGFFPRDDNDRQWELPNVIGVRAVAK